MVLSFYIVQRTDRENWKIDVNNVVCLSEEELGWTRVLPVVPVFRPCINLALFTFDLCVLFGLLCSQNESSRNAHIGEPQRNAEINIVTLYRLRFTLYTASLSFNNFTFYNTIKY